MAFIMSEASNNKDRIKMSDFKRAIAATQLPMGSHIAIADDKIITLLQEHPNHKIVIF